jgi:hypothetical protein
MAFSIGSLIKVRAPDLETLGEIAAVGILCGGFSIFQLQRRTPVRADDRLHPPAT